MNRQRYAISSPGVSTSTMNAVICLRSLPLTIFDGVRAMTTSTPALTPLVHQSFSPFKTNSEPSSVGSAFRLSVAGSEPACVSVNANAEISPDATRGRYFSFCSSVPNNNNGCATRIDWGGEGGATPSPPQLQKKPAARQCFFGKNPTPPYFFGTLIPNA